MKKIMFMAALATLPLMATSGYAGDSIEKMRSMELPANINFYETSDGGAMGREFVNTYMSMEVNPVVDSALKLAQRSLEEGIITRAYSDGIRSTHAQMLSKIATQQVIFMDFHGSPAELKAEMEKAKSLMDEAKKSFTQIKTDLTVTVIRYKLTQISRGMESDLKSLDEARKRIAGY